MPTPLTLYPVPLFTPTVPSATQLVNNISGAGAANIATALGSTGTLFGEIVGSGTTNAWPALLGLPDPTGNGFLFDNPTPTRAVFGAGVWTFNQQYALGFAATSVIADLYARVSVWQATAGTYVPFGTLVLPAQTLTTTLTTYTISGNLPNVTLGLGDRLYFDWWAFVSVNTGSPSNQTILYPISSNTGFGSTSATSIVTPGYTLQTVGQVLAQYSYGGFGLNDGAAYSVQTKEFPFPEVRPALYKIARQAGMKKTGETVNELTIPITVRVIGTSRFDLEEKIDALFGALALRQQPLTLHSADARYWIADALVGKVSYAPGTILSVIVPITFQAQQPYAFAAQSSSFTTPTLMPTPANGVATVGTQSIDGGGTIYSYPTFTITNLSSGNNLTLNTALVSGNNYTSIIVNSVTTALLTGDTLQLSNTGHTQNVVLTAGAAASGSPVTLSIASINANFSYPATTTTVTKQAQFTQVVVTQLTDGQTLTIAGLNLLPTHFLTITCDPTAANGYTVIQDSNGVPLAFSGVFPVMEPGVTNWSVAISTPSNPNVS